MYTMSAIPGSVMMVAGLELTRTVVTPSSRRALQACVPCIVELSRLPNDNGP